MLSARRWTVTDSILALFVLLLGLRLLSAAEAGSVPHDDQTDGPWRFSQLLTHPIPTPTTAFAEGWPVRLDAAARCQGLVVAERRYQCWRATGPACADARAKSQKMSEALRLSQGDGKPIPGLDQRIERYAHAYGGGLAGTVPGASAALARDRMRCQAYRAYFALMPEGIPKPGYM